MTIRVTKPYLPPIERYLHYVQRAYAGEWLTNDGPLLRELTQRLGEYLQVQNLLLVANGTLALQIAYRALGIRGAAVTTPFTFVATPASLKWEGIDAVFSDIDPDTGTLDAGLAGQMGTADISALVPVHVYGNACDVRALVELARRRNWKTVYDASHAFAVRHMGRSLLSYGDASTLSFHATKLFHSAEGGAIVFRHADDLQRAKEMINFGIDVRSAEIVGLGVNAKMSELHAAMGLAVLDDIDRIISDRREIVDVYESELAGAVDIFLGGDGEGGMRNGAYVPVVFDSEALKLAVIKALAREHIAARAYFSPSLDSLEFYGRGSSRCCPRSRSIAERVLCLPIYTGLPLEEVRRIARVVREAIGA